jgi:hypothetical protein
MGEGHLTQAELAVYEVVTGDGNYTNRQSRSEA